MKNRFEVRGDVTAIFLSSPTYGDMETLISTSDFDRVNEFPNTWIALYAPSGAGSFYVYGRYRNKETGKEFHRLHRWIMGDNKGFYIDHVNHDTLNNTRDNLREVTSSQNNQNRAGAQKNSSSGVRGVRLNKKGNKWLVRFKLDRKEHYVGSFDDLEDAEFAAIEARRKYMSHSIEI